MSDSVDRVFVHALNTVKRIPRTGTARPPTAERLKLYGLYKQSMEGDVEGVMRRPVGNTTDVYAECEKWDAWFSQRGVSHTEAKRRYISTLIETMHRYASQTPEARELVAELEFVWDQIKANTMSEASSPVPQQDDVPMQFSPAAAVSPSRDLHQARQFPSSPQRYASIGGRLAQPPSYEDMVAIANADNHRGRREPSRLRVLSPVSQPDEMYQRRGSGMRSCNSGSGHGPQDGDEDEDEDEGGEAEEEEDEEYQEAQDNFDDDDDDNDNNYQYHHSQHTSHRDTNTSASSLQQHHSSSPSECPPPSKSKSTSKTDPRRWRRRVEQALTNMTAEVAAVREQMELRAIQHRRRTSAWAWVKWLAWVILRQVLWDLAVLAMLLIWMRVRGDRRVEERIKAGWGVIRRRLGRLRFSGFRLRGV